jgi:hypothetical protein
MQIDVNGQAEKQKSSISLSCEFASNANNVILASEKQDFLRTRTDRGMQIDFSEHLEKLISSSRLNCESDAKSSRSMLPFEKHSFGIAPREPGMQIDFSEQSLKHSSPTSRKRDPVSNVSDSICECAKQERPRTSTDAGTSIPLPF